MLFEERSDEFHVFPETRRRVETVQSGYRATERNRPEAFLDNKYIVDMVKLPMKEKKEEKDR